RARERGPVTRQGGGLKLSTLSAPGRRLPPLTSYRIAFSLPQQGGGRRIRATPCYSASSWLRAAARLRRRSSETSGFLSPSPQIADVRTSATTARATHLWSAGTTYHGAQRVLVASNAASYAPMYLPQWPRSARSAAENFQCLSGSSSRSRKRRRCSSR